jgi:hypothetical protein
MFCADYMATFVFHVALSAGLMTLMEQEAGRRLAYNALGLSYTFQHNGQSRSEARDQPSRQALVSVIAPPVLGAVAGACGTAAVFPLDFVRASLAAPSLSTAQRFARSLSTVPYSSVYFGLYFAQRDPHELESQLTWGVGSAVCASLAETPFDHAKRSLFGGNRRVLIGANMLYVPFAALLLIGYDRAMMGYLQRRSR